MGDHVEVVVLILACGLCQFLLMPGELERSAFQGSP